MASNPLMVYIISSSSSPPLLINLSIQPIPTWKRVPQDKGSAKRCVCFTKLGHFLATKTGRRYHRGGGKTGATGEKRTTLWEKPKRGNSFRSKKNGVWMIITIKNPLEPLKWWFPISQSPISLGAEIFRWTTLNFRRVRHLHVSCHTIWVALRSPSFFRKTRSELSYWCSTRHVFLVEETYQPDVS